MTTNKDIAKDKSVLAWDDNSEYTVLGTYIRYREDSMFPHVVLVNGICMVYKHAKALVYEENSLTRDDVKKLLTQFFGKNDMPNRLLEWVDEYKP